MGCCWGKAARAHRTFAGWTRREVVTSSAPTQTSRAIFARPSRGPPKLTRGRPASASPQDSFFLQLPLVPGFLPGVGSYPSQQRLLLSLFLLAAFFLGAVFVGILKMRLNTLGRSPHAPHFWTQPPLTASTPPGTPPASTSRAKPSPTPSVPGRSRPERTPSSDNRPAGGQAGENTT